MNRKCFLVAFPLIVVTGVVNAASSLFYWPHRNHQKPSAPRSFKALQKHVATHERHEFGWDRINDLSFEELVYVHDQHHIKIGNNPPLNKHTPDPENKAELDQRFQIGDWEPSPPPKPKPPAPKQKKPVSPPPPKPKPWKPRTWIIEDGMQFTSRKKK